MKKFKNKYRIESARAEWWDYSGNGAYFLTINTAYRAHLFGRVQNKEMYLSEAGIIVQKEWDKSFEIRKELFCDAFVIMPDHLHCIVWIGKPVDSAVETHGRASPLQNQQNHGAAYRPPKSISSFIAGFKSSATKKINEYRKTPGLPVWQTRFHDHIIRDIDEYYRIKQYILDNPENWNKG